MDLHFELVLAGRIIYAAFLGGMVIPPLLIAAKSRN